MDKLLFSCRSSFGHATKTKRKITVPERLGAGNKFLNENFSEVPENLEDVLKGHV